MQRQLIERGVVLNGLLHGHIAAAGEGGGGVVAEALVNRHGGGHGIELALQIRARHRGLGRRPPFGEPGVLKHRLGIAFQTLDRSERGAAPLKHDLVVLPPLEPEISLGLEQPIVAGHPDMGDIGRQRDGDGWRNDLTTQGGDGGHARAGADQWRGLSALDREIAGLVYLGHRGVRGQHRLCQLVLVVGILIELHQLAVDRNGWEQNMRQDGVIEKISDGTLAGVQAGPNIQRVVVDIVLEVVGVATITRDEGSAAVGAVEAVQPMALHGELEQGMIGLQRPLQELVGAAGEKRIQTQACFHHGGTERIELALRVLAVDRLLRLAEVLQAGVEEHRLGIGLQPLDVVQAGS